MIPRKIKQKPVNRTAQKEGGAHPLPPMLGNPLVSSSRTRRKFLRSVGFSIAYQKVSVLRAGPVEMSKNFWKKIKFCQNLRKKVECFLKFSEENQILLKSKEKSRFFFKAFGKK